MVVVYSPDLQLLNLIWMFIYFVYFRDLTGNKITTVSNEFLANFPNLETL